MTWTWWLCRSSPSQSANCCEDFAQPCDLPQGLARSDKTASTACYKHSVGLTFSKAGDEEAVAVPFRYNISGLSTGKTNVYKPNACEADRDALRHQVLGAIYAGNFHRVIRGTVARLVWEVACLHINCGSFVNWVVISFGISCQVEFSESPPKIFVAKPRVYTVAKIRIPPKSWVELC